MNELAFLNVNFVVDTIDEIEIESEVDIEWERTYTLTHRRVVVVAVVVVVVVVDVVVVVVVAHVELCNLLSLLGMTRKTDNLCFFDHNFFLFDSSCNESLTTKLATNNYYLLLCVSCVLLFVLTKT